MKLVSLIGLFLFVNNESGIVRGIDTIRQVLYLITPVPVDSLEKVDLLLQGFIEIPTSLLQVSLPSYYEYQFLTSFVDLLISFLAFCTSPEKI